MSPSAKLPKATAFAAAGLIVVGVGLIVFSAMAVSALVGFDGWPGSSAPQGQSAPVQVRGERDTSPTVPAVGTASARETSSRGRVKAASSAGPSGTASAPGNSQAPKGDVTGSDPATSGAAPSAVAPQAQAALGQGPPSIGALLQQTAGTKPDVAARLLADPSKR